MARSQDDHLWALAHAERTALATDLAGLEAGQWRHGTLCGEWDVEQVVAHLTAAVLRPRRRHHQHYRALAPHRTQVAGLTLRADDGPFASGTGPLVTGSTLALVMGMAGRASYLAELDGPGVPALRSRLAL
jgi:hypothetical protein